MMDIDIQIATILSHRTKKGMVEFTIKEDDKEIKVQWDIGKAREIRNMLQESIEAAISDEMIYTWLTTKVGLPDDKASHMLLDFRFIRQGSRDAVYPT